MAQASGSVGGKEKTMFISKIEKEEMQKSITYLLGEFSKLWSEYLVIKGKLKAAEGNIFVLKETIEQNKPKPKPKTTAAQRAKQREYMRKYKARKKAEKAAQLAQAVA
jgi:hypothetical protein